MSKKILYQTVRDTGNPKEILKEGPFKCTKDPWLGDGYYFWDTFIGFAHWWGRVRYNKQYVITRIDIDYKPDEILDLVGNTEQIEMFREISDELNNDKEFGNLTVAEIIQLLKETTSFPYKAIRAEVRDSVRYQPEETANLKKRISFKKNNKAYLNLYPQYQICYIHKEDVLNDTYSIIFPDSYRTDYSI